MRVALTGATGLIGSHVLTDLLEHGHEVTALVRDDDDAGVVAARGATPAVVDLYDRPTVLSLLNDAEGAIHTASPGDETSANLDSAVVDAAIRPSPEPASPISTSAPSGSSASNPPSPAVPQERARPGLVEGTDRGRVLDAVGMRGVVMFSRRRLWRRWREFPGSFSVRPGMGPAT